MPSLISVVIATRDRSAALQTCLEALRAGALPADWCAEVIVVDNASSDDTPRVVDSFQSSPPDRTFHYMMEPRRGKGFAVNRGLSAVRGDIVAFVDDDVAVDAGWMIEIIDQFRRDPALGVLAGRVIAIGREGATTVGADEVTLSAARPLIGLVMGCNLAVRREVLATVKGRDTRLGPGRGLSAEDIDFVYRILKAGFRGRFSPRPAVTHSPSLRDRRREYLRGRGAYYAKYVSRGDLVITRQAWWEMIGIWRELWRPGPRRAGSALDDFRQIATGAGMMLGRMIWSRRPEDLSTR